MHGISPSLIAALAVGLLGSVHCIGMCGPIAVALPWQGTSRVRLVTGLLLYNAGRIVTYMLLGVLAGIVSEVVAGAAVQQAASIATGALLILAAIVPGILWRRVLPSSIGDRIGHAVRRLWQKLIHKRGLLSLLTIGILNGFLPCGLVYVALAVAVTGGGMLRAVEYMALFGLGTVPAMFATAFLGKMIGAALRNRLVRLLPVGLVILGTLLMLRGMSLGIPYISPRPGHAVHDASNH